MLLSKNLCWKTGFKAVRLKYLFLHTLFEYIISGRHMSHMLGLGANQEIQFFKVEPESPKVRILFSYMPESKSTAILIGSACWEVKKKRRIQRRKLKEGPFHLYYFTKRFAQMWHKAG